MSSSKTATRVIEKLKALPEAASAQIVRTYQTTVTLCHLCLAELVTPTAAGLARIDFLESVINNEARVQAEFAKGELFVVEAEIPAATAVPTTDESILVRCGRAGTKTHRGLPKSSRSFCGEKVVAQVSGPVKGKNLCGRCWSPAACASETLSWPVCSSTNR